MTAASAFSLVNLVALIAWIFLIGPGRWKPEAFRVVRVAFPVVLAVCYLAALGTALPGMEPGGGFNSLEEVAALFRNEWALVAGWIHYLAFDFFVGCWILATAREEQVSHWLTVPALVVTFMLGPAGYLLFQGVRLARRRKLAGQGGSL